MTLAELLALSAKTPKAQARSFPDKRQFRCPHCDGDFDDVGMFVHAQDCHNTPSGWSLLKRRAQAQARPRTPLFLCPDCGKGGFDFGDVTHAKGCSLARFRPKTQAQMQSLMQSSRAETSVEGLAVCMTGFRDADMEAAIRRAGGSVVSGVSKNLDILVAKDPHSTSGKAQKARELGIPVLSIAQMNARLRS